MASPDKIHLGDLMVQQRLISEDQLAEALTQQRRSGRKLGRLLAENGFATEDEISASLAHQLHLPVVDLKRMAVNPTVARLLPEGVAKRFRAVLVENPDDHFLLAMADPTDLLAYDTIRHDLGWDVKLAVASESSVGRYINLAYGYPSPSSMPH